MTISLRAATAVLMIGLLASVEAQAGARAYEGWKLYNTYCFLCHGVSGKGDGPMARSLSLSPKNLTESKYLEGLSDRDLVRTVQGTAAHAKLEKMPQWGTILAEPQIEAVVSYVRYLSRSQHELVGDPEQGKQVYQRYCVACHGQDGKGDGPLTNLLPIKPTDHTNAKVMNRFDNRKLMAIVLHGEGKRSYMPAWEGVLTASEVDALVSYIRLLSHGK